MWQPTGGMHRSAREAKASSQGRRQEQESKGACSEDGADGAPAVHMGLRTTPLATRRRGGVCHHVQPGARDCRTSHEGLSASLWRQGGCLRFESQPCSASSRVFAPPWSLKRVPGHQHSCDATDHLAEPVAFPPDVPPSPQYGAHALHHRRRGLLCAAVHATNPDGLQLAAPRDKVQACRGRAGRALSS